MKIKISTLLVVILFSGCAASPIYSTREPVLQDTWYIYSFIPDHGGKVCNHECVIFTLRLERPRCFIQERVVHYPINDMSRLLSIFDKRRIRNIFSTPISPALLEEEDLGKIEEKIRNFPHNFCAQVAPD
jgi:hypothetical protein